MGGFGSGRWRQHAKMTTVEDCAVISLSEFIRRGLLRTPAAFLWTGEGPLQLIYNLVRTARTDIRVKLSYNTQAAGRTHRVVQDIPLTSTTSPVGVHFWFACPLLVEDKPCGRRVDKLYLPPSATHFGCRQCHRLTYRSCQESHYWDSFVRGLGMTPAEQRQVVRFFAGRRGRFLAAG